MTKLEKSIRHALAFYGPSIRAGRYWYPGESGTPPETWRGFVSSLKTDYDRKTGLVTDMRLYTVGDAMERRDYYNQSVDITEPLLRYLSGDYSYAKSPWDRMIADMVKTVKEQTKEETE